MSNLIVNLRLPQLRMRPVTGAALFRYERMVCGKWVSCNHSRATAIVGVFNRRVKALCAKLTESSETTMASPSESYGGNVRPTVSFTSGKASALLAANDYDERRADQVKEFLNSFGVSELVTIKGIVYRIVDIGMRMLQPHELYRAQGFPEWYIIDRDYRGVKYAKDKQVARCGNAVPPPFAEALVRANLPEMCVNKQERAA